MHSNSPGDQEVQNTAQGTGYVGTRGMQYAGPGTYCIVQLNIMTGVLELIDLLDLFTIPVRKRQS